MLLSIDYRPTKYSPIITQWFRIRVYPVHHTMNNNFINHLGVSSEDSFKHIRAMLEFKNDIHIELLRIPDEEAGYGQMRGTAGDLEPVVINGHALSYFTIVFNQNTGIFSYPDGKLTPAQSATLFDWFGATLKTFLSDSNIKKMHDIERERYVKETIGRLGRAIDDLVEIQEKLFGELDAPDERYVCPECENDLVLDHSGEGSIDPDTGKVFMHMDNRIHCSACDWETDEDFQGVVNLNLSLNRLG